MDARALREYYIRGADLRADAGFEEEVMPLFARLRIEGVSSSLQHLYTVSTCVGLHRKTRRAPVSLIIVSRHRCRSAEDMINGMLAHPATLSVLVQNPCALTGAREA